MNESCESAKAVASLVGDRRETGQEAGTGQGEWLAQPRRLAFCIGDIRLGSVELPCLALTTHFLRLTGGAPEPVLPFERFPDGTEVAIAYSYPIPRPLPRLSTFPRAIRYVPAQYRRHYIDLTGSFETYQEKFSSKSCSTLRKKVRKFAEFSGGKIAWRVFDPPTMDEFHRLAYELSARTYQARLLDSGLPEVGRFRQILSQCPDARGYVLIHAGRPIAYIFCSARDGNLFYDYVGYDPDYQQWSPGTVLQYLALESLFAEGRFRTFDFTEGDGPHKEFFANRSTLCADIHYFRKTARNFLLVYLHSGLHSTSSAAARLLDRVGLKAHLKKMIRSRG